eukprot:scaffold84088_cov69-Phaeocystis_antarctica.AAC.1
MSTAALKARQQAQAEKLTLLVAECETGYFGVRLGTSGRSKPYYAGVRRDGKQVYLGCFATAEEAALCIARTPEGQVAAQRAVAAAGAAAPLTSEEARQQAQAEKLTLLVAETKTGYFGVYHNPGRSKPFPKPYQVRVSRGGKDTSLGYFVTAEEAALCVARSPEGQAAAAKRAAAAVPLTSEEARQQAQTEGLTLRMSEADNATGYFGVSHQPGRRLKPYRAHVWRGRKTVTLGYFATAEEAALCVARSPEGQAAAGRAASAESQGTLPAVPPGASLKEEGTVPAMPPGAVVKEEGVVPPMPPGAYFKKEDAVPLMPSDAFVKQEHEVAVKEGLSNNRGKRQRSE